MDDIIKDIKRFVNEYDWSDIKDGATQHKGTPPPNIKEFVEEGKKYRWKKGHNKGVPLSEETKEKIRRKALGRKHSEKTKRKISKVKKGTRHTEETKSKIAENNAKYWKGKTGELHHATGSKRPDNLKRMHLMWEANRGKARTHNKVTCPHCGKEGGDNVMKRWHFDNCRSKS